MPIPSVVACKNKEDEDTIKQVSACSQTTSLVEDERSECNNNMTKKEDETMETDDNQRKRINKKQQKKLLHARRDDNDKTVNLSDYRLQTHSKSALYPGSRFSGSQKCGPSSYEVEVEILNVDMKDSTLCGYLKIKGLTAEFPELTTFFHAEIIGSKYSFHTRKWHADQQIDLLHWKKFPSFKPYVDTFHRDDFMYNMNNDDFIYMRWKETFLVPNHRVNSIHGASYAGFYYICYQCSTNTITGFYFYRHHKDWFQELNLTHIPDHGLGHFEFR